MTEATFPEAGGTEEILLRGAHQLDGSGGPGEVADLRLGHGTILERGADLSRRGATVIEMSGSYLAPGFIDVHSHSDLTVLANPGLESKVTQGVTTEVVGNCGSSPFPVVPARRQELRDYLDAFYPGVSRHSAWDWEDLAGWTDRVAQARPAVNLAPLVGHGSVRIAVAGFRNRAFTLPERAEALGLVETALAQGAFGFSTGLAYSPELDTRPEDLAPFLRAVAHHDRVYATHQRDEGRGGRESLRESLASAEAAGARLEVSHLKCLGRAQWGTAGWLLADLARARRDGAPARADFYPYRAGETTLAAFVPAWLLEGTWPDVESRLRDPAARSRARGDVLAGQRGWTIAEDHLTWGDVVLSTLATETHRDYLGRSVEEVAHREGRDPIDLVFDLLLGERGGVSVLVFGAGQEDVEQIGRDADVLVGSDGIGNSLTTGPLFGPIHPRNYGTFPRFLSEQPDDGLAGAIRRLTRLPAEHFRVPRRGSLSPGNVADLVSWTVGARDPGPDYGEAPRYSRLFDSVWVGGVPAVWNGSLTGRRSGRVLRPAHSSAPDSPG